LPAPPAVSLGLGVSLVICFFSMVAAFVIWVF
jgi:hypothetical protein